MGKFRFYNERTNLRVGSSVLLTKDEAEHIRKSLRLTKGDEVFIFNGFKEFRAKLSKVTNNETLAVIEGIVDEQKEVDKKLICFLGLSKANSFELALQKITEVGIDKIIPLMTDFSVVQLDKKIDKKMARWKKIILEACKQSERISVPELEAPIAFSDLKTQDLQSYTKVLFFTTPNENRFDFRSIDSNDKIAFFIGPEGGFSPDEEKYAETIKLTKISLPGNILKTETAAIVATALIRYS